MTNVRETTLVCGWSDCPHGAPAGPTEGQNRRGCSEVAVAVAWRWWSAWWQSALGLPQGLSSRDSVGAAMSVTALPPRCGRWCAWAGAPHLPLPGRAGGPGSGVAD